MNSGRTAAQYRREIDGLRAVAVLMVLFYHAGLSACSGGFVGVDVFFVISGFLIAAIVLRETEAGTFSFAGFYERRVRRIMPALLTMLAVSAAFSLILLPDDMLAYGKSLLATVTFSSNFFFWRSLGYFGIDPQYAPLLNTWSLAVEEQLYLVLPALLAGVAGHFGWRGTIVLVAATGVGAAVLGLLVVDRIPYAGFFWPILRGAEFLLGAGLSTGGIPRPRSRAAGDALAALGLALIASDLPRQHLSPFFPGIEVLLAAGGAALFIYGTDMSGSIVARIMSARPLVLIGLASYSLYLWHWPIIAFGTYYILDGNLMATAKIVLALASIPIAFLSWHFVERPFRGPSPILSLRGAFLWAAVASGALAAFASLVIVLHGVPGRFDAVTQRIVADRTLFQNPCNDQSARSVADGRLCKLGDPHAKPGFIVIGDSHADMYFAALDALARQHGVSGYMFSSPACRSFVFAVSEPADQRCADRNIEVRKLILALRPKAIVIAQRWSTADFARQAAANADPRGALWLAEMDLGLARMARLAREAGSTLFIVRDVPEAHVAVTRTLAKARILGLDDANGNPPGYLPLAVPRTEFARSEALPEASFATLAAHFPVRMLDPASLLCGARQCRVQQGGLPLYRDTHHLNRAGAASVMPAFAPLMRELTGH